MPLKYAWVPLPHGRLRASARYEALFRGDAVRSAFGLLIKLSHARRSEYLPETTSGQASLLSIVRAPKEQIPVRQATTEYGQITIAAASDTVGTL